MVDALGHLFPKVWQAMFRVSGFKPRSLTGKAVAYALRQREGLRVCLEHGRVEIDNNRVENAIRPVALGRKNFLFIGDRDAGWRSAVLYTGIQSCRNHGVDPYAYLKDVLERLPMMTNQQLHSLTPRAWAASRQKQKTS